MLKIFLIGCATCTINNNIEEKKSYKMSDVYKSEKINKRNFDMYDCDEKNNKLFDICNERKKFDDKNSQRKCISEPNSKIKNASVIEKFESQSDKIYENLTFGNRNNSINMYGDNDLEIKDIYKVNENYDSICNAHVDDIFMITEIRSNIHDEDKQDYKNNSSFGTQSHSSNFYENIPSKTYKEKLNQKVVYNNKLSENNHNFLPFAENEIYAYNILVEKKKTKSNTNIFNKNENTFNDEQYYQMFHLTDSEKKLLRKKDEPKIQENKNSANKILLFETQYNSVDQSLTYTIKLSVVIASIFMIILIIGLLTVFN